MTFEIFLSRQAKKFLDKLDATTRDRIVEKVKLLVENPFAIPYKKIKDRDRPPASNIYLFQPCLHDMSTTTYSVRIPKDIREAMERMKDVNWQEEIRKMIIERVREEAKRRLLAEARELRSKMKTSKISEMIREDRNAR